MFMPLTFALAPTLGGILQERFQWQSVFLFLIVYMGMLLCLVCFNKESLTTPSQEKITKIFATYRSHLKNPLFFAFGLNFIIPSFGLFAYLSASPFIFQEVIGLSPSEYGILSLYVGGTIILSGYINLRLLHCLTVVQVLYIGSGLIVCAGALLLTFHMLNILTTWSVLFPSLILFTCLPLCISNAASKSFSFIKVHFGAASAILTTMQFLTGALASYIFSLLSAQNALPLAISFLIVGITSLLNLKIACGLENKLTEKTVV